MKYATLSKSAFAVTSLVAALAACANSADVPPEETAPADTSATTPPPATTVPAAAPASAPATAPEKKCAATCATDSDCANTCPALAGGVQCCDLKTKTCWGSKTSTCPAPADPDAGATPPPAY